MIDIHNHVLPGLGDGPRNLDESLALLRVAVADGIQTLVATPRVDGQGHAAGVVQVTGSCLRVVRRLADEHELPIQLLAGYELVLRPDVLEAVGDLRGLGLNGSRYLLLELPAGATVADVESGIMRIQSAGMRPVLAHAERYLPIQQDLGVAATLNARGVLLQVDAESLIGNCDRLARDCARQLVRGGYASFLATGRESPELGTGRLRKAVAVVSRLVGTRAAQALVVDNPAAALLDRDVAPVPRAGWGRYFTLRLTRAIRAERPLIPERPALPQPLLATADIRTR